MLPSSLPAVLLTASLLAAAPAGGPDAAPAPAGPDTAGPAPAGPELPGLERSGQDRARVAPATPTLTAWRSPVHPLVVVRRFDPPDQPWLPGHRGVDLRTRPGDPVHAAGAGTVTFAADLAGRGVVVVDHGTLRTTYEPVDATAPLGQQVGPGDPIGVVGTGSGHCGSGTCVHLGLRRGRTYLDPLLVLRRSVTRLRPW